MKMSLARVMVIVPAVLLIWAGCSKKGGPETPNPYNEVQMELFNFTSLPDSFAYVLWAKPPDTVLSVASAVWKRLTRFNANSAGGVLDSNGNLIPDSTFSGLPANLDDYDLLQVTIERTSDHPTTPSPTVYLWGRIPSNLDSATIARLEFPGSLRSAGGFCDLLTPTDSDTSNELSGVWFMMKDFPGPSDSGLFIPPAPSGWRYEGWVWHRNIWLSTGKFQRASGPDLANPYSGPIAAPDFPGEDFLLNAPGGIDFGFPFELTVGDCIRVTMEPDPDPGVTPFGVIVVSTLFTSRPVPHTLVSLAAAPETAIPAANVTIARAD